MDICTLWLGKKLRFCDQLCLRSMVKVGHHVKLYTYEEVENVPKGVEICDAEPILPFSFIYRLDPYFPCEKKNITIVQFSDIFRVALMEKSQGFWLDSDVYLVKKLHIDKSKVWLAKENSKRVGVSAFYLPPNNPIITEFDKYLHSNQTIPNWLGFKRAVVRPQLLKLKKQEVLPKNLGATIFGNDGISRLARKYGFFSQAHAKETFYYWTGRKAERIFMPRFGLEPLQHKDFLGFHIHRKQLTEQPAKKGSFYAWAIEQAEM